MVQLICLQGNIGAGKSTILEMLRQKFKAVSAVVFVQEPVDEWEAHGLLKAMYDGTIDTGLFEVVALTTILRRLCMALRTQPHADVIIAERCHSSVMHVFAKLNLDSTRMTAFQLAYQSAIVSSNIETMIDSVTHVYLKVPVDTLITRIRTRNRNGEHSIPSEYLQQLQERHETWLPGSHDSRSVVVVDAQRTAAVVADEVAEIVRHALMRSHRLNHATLSG